MWSKKIHLATLSKMFLFNSSQILNKVVRRVVQVPHISLTRMGSSNSKKSAIPKTNRGARGTDPDERYIESVVCKVDDLKDNEMKVFEIGEEGKVLVVKQKGAFNAVGTKCTHYGAPLITGALGDGRVRCPWHGACFSLKTGDIEDFPGFDSLPCYQVSVTPKGEVKVRAKVGDLKANRRTKDMGAVSPSDTSSVVIVGGGPSGATCAENLRSEGYKGRIALVCKENFLPYDRVKVSKVGAMMDIKKLEARTPEFYQKANIDVIKGVEVIKIYPEEKSVQLSNGEKLDYTSLYIATGVKPYLPEIPGIGLKNIFVARNFEDSVNIITALGSGKDKNVVSWGLSFTGLEIASSCYQKANSMTVVGRDYVPLRKIFGIEVGKSLQKLFEDKGVIFHLETTIAKVNGENGMVKSVELTNGNTIPADILVVGIGGTFYTDFLKESGIDMNADGTINVNDKLETNIKDIYAGGDIACAPVFANGNKPMAIGHLGLAQYHGITAAKNILNKGVSLRAVPYFWTVLFGKSIRLAGCGVPDSFQIEGDVEALKFVIFFFDTAEKVISVASCARDPVVSQFAELLYQGKELHKKDLTPDPFAWIAWIN